MTSPKSSPKRDTTLAILSTTVKIDKETRQKLRDIALPHEPVNETIRRLLGLTPRYLDLINE